TKRQEDSIESRIRVAALVVILQYLFQRCDAAVMHVWRGAGDLAQRRRLERAAIFWAGGNGEPALIRQPSIAPSDARVVKALVGKCRAAVTPCASRLAE